MELENSAQSISVVFELREHLVRQHDSESVAACVEDLETYLNDIGEAREDLSFDVDSIRKESSRNPNLLYFTLTWKSSDSDFEYDAQQMLLALNVVGASGEWAGRVDSAVDRILKRTEEHQSLGF
jgi:hypothetical protein